MAAAVVMVLGALRIGKARLGRADGPRAPTPRSSTASPRSPRDWPGVRGFHDLKTRTAGSRVFVNLHIELDGDQPLRDAHDIGAGLRRAILAAYPQADVIIHKDVFDG